MISVHIAEAGVFSSAYLINYFIRYLRVIIGSEGSEVNSFQLCSFEQCFSDICTCSPVPIFSSCLVVL